MSAGGVLVDLHDAAGGLAVAGAVRLAGAVSEDVCTELSDRGGHTWRALATQVGQITQAGWYCQPPVASLPTAVRQFSQGLAGALVTQLPELSVPGQFNELTWQRHTPSEGGVSPHRDQSSYTGVVAVLSLSGAARFAVLATRDAGAVVEEWVAEAGDLTLMLGGGHGHADRRPWHMVDPPASPERVTLTFRHTAGEPGGWE